MAVDDESKRKSVPRGPTGVPGTAPGPTPDGTIDAGDRQHIAGVYRGIAAGTGPSIIETFYFGVAPP